MTDREKLIELFEGIETHLRLIPEFYVDYLIANGVTVQKWIPVTERLPSKEEYIAYAVDCVTFYKRMVFIHKTDTMEYEFGCYDGHKWISEWNYVIPNVVAWMPLPEPPKEE